MSRDFIERREGEQKFNFLPSFFTLCNGLCGFAAILLTVKAYGSSAGVPTFVVWMIFGAMFFDVLDGLTARLLNACSLHGMNLDSLCDAISFGVAPALFIFVQGQSFVSAHEFASEIVLILSGLYLICALWRLAVYNTRSMLGIEEEDHIAFIGLPSPAAAGMVVCMLWLLPRLHFELTAHFSFYAFYTMLASLLMVSTVPYPHLRNLCHRLPRKVAFLFVLFSVLLVIRFGLLALVLLAHLYLISSPIGEMISRIIPSEASRFADD